MVGVAQDHETVVDMSEESQIPDQVDIVKCQSIKSDLDVHTENDDVMGNNPQITVKGENGQNENDFKIEIGRKTENEVKSENIVKNHSEINNNAETETSNNGNHAADMNDINPWPSLNEIYRTKSNNSSSTKKTETNKSKNKHKKCKWKKAPGELVQFEINLKVPRPVLDPRVLYTLDRELKCFDDSLDNINPGSTSSSDDLMDQSTEKGPEELKSSSDDLKGPDSETVCEEKEVSKATEVGVAYEMGMAYYIDEDLSDWNEFCCYHGPNTSIYEDTINKNIHHKLETYLSLGTVQRLRKHKHKWKVMKAHKQIKTKHCRSIKNCTRGKRLYIKHRVKKLIELESSRLTCIPNYRMTYKYIDKKLEREGAISGEGRAVSRITRINYPVAPRPVAHTLTAYNADGDLDAQLINILITMQNRDLTPEDYELLLQLDNRVNPKTVQENILKSFKKDTVTEADTDQICSVCIENYVQGQVRKYLPCGHYFHADCIDTWLKKSSMNCPLDGLPVEKDQ